MRFLSVLVIFLLLLAGVVCGTAQSSTPRPAAGAASPPADADPADSSAEPAAQRRSPFPQEEKDPIRQEMEKRRQKAMNKERFNDLKRDTDKLLELATELKTHVDKADENMLSLDVLKRAEQIEKLAKSVREKMKGY